MSRERNDAGVCIKRHRWSLVLGLCACVSCATRGSERGDQDAPLPHAHAGPFRELREGELAELSGPAPTVLRNKARRFREPAVLDLDGTGSAGRAALYAVARIDGITAIYRFLAADARSFSPDPQPAGPVLEPRLGWEGDWVGAPSVHWVGTEVWLFYAAAGGIGLARSPDGLQFSRESSPILAPTSEEDWEGGLPPAHPAFLEVADDDYRLFYSVSGRIGEAQSSDGRRFTRLGNSPLLTPASATAGTGAHDESAVEEPHAVLARSPEGRRVLRVYYAGRDSSGGSRVGLAARFGNQGPLQRAYSPVLSTTRNPRSPWVLPLRDLTLLFSTQQAGVTAGLDFPAIAVAVTPADVSLITR